MSEPWTEHVNQRLRNAKRRGTLRVTVSPNDVERVGDLIAEMVRDQRIKGTVQATVPSIET